MGWFVFVFVFCFLFFSYLPNELCDVIDRVVNDDPAGIGVPMFLHFVHPVGLLLFSVILKLILGVLGTDLGLYGVLVAVIGEPLLRGGKLAKVKNDSHE